MADKDKLIKELKQRVQQLEPLPGEPDFFTKEETLIRYLKARDWNLSESERMLRDTIEYRRDTKPMHTECKWCLEQPGYHSLRQVGLDESGRPVIYSNFSQAAVHRNTAEDAITHVTHVFENAKKTMAPGITTWVLVLDCTGMTLTACNPKLSYGVIQHMSNHYPERLGMVICLNHNPVFHGVWKAVKVFLQQNTQTKMKLMRSKEKILQSFNQYFSEDLSTWLLDEIKLNKRRPISTSQLTFWYGPEDNASHDPRGCPEYVRDYVEPYLHDRGNNDTIGHKPHPNIVSVKLGNGYAVAVSPDEIMERENDNEVPSDETQSNDGDNDDHAARVVISDEFQIPKDATHLCS